MKNRLAFPPGGSADNRDLRWIDDLIQPVCGLYELRANYLMLSGEMPNGLYW